LNYLDPLFLRYTLSIIAGYLPSFASKILTNRLIVAKRYLE